MYLVTSYKLTYFPPRNLNCLGNSSPSQTLCRFKSPNGGSTYLLQVGNITYHDLPGKLDNFKSCFYYHFYFLEFILSKQHRYLQKIYIKHTCMCLITYLEIQFEGQVPKVEKLVPPVGVYSLRICLGIWISTFLRCKKF